MSRAMEAVRLAGMAVTALGASQRSLWIIVTGSAIVLFGWLCGKIGNAYPGDAAPGRLCSSVSTKFNPLSRSHALQRLPAGSGPPSLILFALCSLKHSQIPGFAARHFAFCFFRRLLSSRGTRSASCGLHIFHPRRSLQRCWGSTRATRRRTFFGPKNSLNPGVLIEEPYESQG